MTNQSGTGRNPLKRMGDALHSFFFPIAQSSPLPVNPRTRRTRTSSRRIAPNAPVTIARLVPFPSEAATPREQHIARRNLYQWMVKVPHREYGQVVPAFREALDDDPDFVSRACVWLNRPESGQQIRDVQDVSCITLLQAPNSYPAYREAGRCVLLGDDVYIGCGMTGLPPFRVFRVLDFIASSDRKVPRLMRSLVVDYFNTLEKDPERLDGAALRNRPAMKKTWVSYHLNQANFPRAHSMLFGQPPEGSRLAALKVIATMPDPTAQAMAIVENRIPYVIATSVIREWTPAVGIALIEAMSPTEAVNSRAWIERAGLLQHPEVRDLYISKVEKARGSVASMSHRLSARGQDEGVDAAIQHAKQEIVSGSRRIQRDTLVLIDKSNSMQTAMAAAQQFGARIGPLCDGELMAVAFDTNAREIKVQEPSNLASWEKAFEGIRSSGSTSIGAGLKYALDLGFQPRQVVVITDAAENTAPYFMDVVKRFDEPPELIFIVVPGEPGWVVDRLVQDGHRVEVFNVEDPGEYGIYDQVAALLGGPAAKSMVDQILETELPRRIA